jgi:hypothetical protein
LDCSWREDGTSGDHWRLGLLAPESSFPWLLIEVEVDVERLIEGIMCTIFRIEVHIVIIDVTTRL